MNVYYIFFKRPGQLLDKEVGLAKGDDEQAAVANFCDGTHKDPSCYCAALKTVTE